MLPRRIRKLVDHPGFRRRPLTVLMRGALWAAAVTLRVNPTFNLTRSGERMKTALDMRFTSVTTFLLRDDLEPELGFLDHLISPGDTVIDVGANIGVYTLKSARLCGPSGRVLSLEPGRDAFEKLQANLGRNSFGWVTPLRVAASDSNSAVRLYHVELGGDPQAFSLVGADRADAFEEVEGATIDSLVERQVLTRVDLIKIDVEGAEPLVLAGAVRTMRDHKPILICELNAYINAGGDDQASQRAWALIQGAGYGALRLTSGRLVEVSTMPEDFCNIIAVPRERLPAFIAQQGRAPAVTHRAAAGSDGPARRSR